MADYKVLIPLDGSPLAEHSLTFLPALTHLGALTPHLLSVVDETEEIHSLSSDEVKERERNVLTTYLHETAADIERLYGLTATFEVQTGTPAEIIQRRLQELSPELLVISTHGRSGVSRWRRGSVAAQLLHSATCPILAVGPRAVEQGEWREGEPTSSFNSILVPLDGSDLAEGALSSAAELAQRFGSKIHLVRTVQIRVPADPDTGAGNIDLTSQLEDAAVNYLTYARAKMPDPAKVVIDVRLGAPATALGEYISAEKIDLVMMTSHGRSGLVRAALGSVTDRLVGNASAPVLVVRSPTESA